MHFPRMACAWIAQVCQENSHYGTAWDLFASAWMKTKHNIGAPTLLATLRKMAKLISILITALPSSLLSENLKGSKFLLNQSAYTQSVWGLELTVPILACFPPHLVNYRNVQKPEEKNTSLQRFRRPYKNLRPPEQSWSFLDCDQDRISPTLLSLVKSFHEDMKGVFMGPSCTLVPHQNSLTTKWSRVVLCSLHCLASFLQFCSGTLGAIKGIGRANPEKCKWCDRMYHHHWLWTWCCPQVLRKPPLHYPDWQKESSPETNWQQNKVWVYKACKVITFFYGSQSCSLHSNKKKSWLLPGSILGISWRDHVHNNTVTVHLKAVTTPMYTTLKPALVVSCIWNRGWSNPKEPSSWGTGDGEEAD